MAIINAGQEMPPQVFTRGGSEFTVYIDTRTSFDDVAEVFTRFPGGENPPLVRIVETNNLFYTVPVEVIAQYLKPRTNEPVLETNISIELKDPENAPSFNGQSRKTINSWFATQESVRQFYTLSNPHALIELSARSIVNGFVNKFMEQGNQPYIDSNDTKYTSGFGDVYNLTDFSFIADNND